MPCEGEGYQSTPQTDPGPVNRGPGGSGKWPPMARAIAIVATALVALPRHNSQPLGNRSGSECFPG